MGRQRSRIRSKPYHNKSKGKENFKGRSLSDVFEADTNSQLNRKGHTLDEVEDYEFHNDKVDEEDDEEIDSDEAFGDSDEEKFTGFKFGGSTFRSSKDEVAEPSDEEKDLDFNESDDIDSGHESIQPAHQKMVDSLMYGQEAEDEDQDGKGEMGDSEDMSDSEDEGDQDEEEAAAKDIDFINSLETKKRKRDDVAGARKRLLASERTEVYGEGEFNLAAGESQSDDTKKTLDMNDLMGSLGDEATFMSLRKSLNELNGKGKGLAKEAMAAPLSKPIQDRIDRQAAYTVAKKEISRWQPTVKENREADHLTFPLQAPPSQKTTSASLASKFAPQTEMEKQIQDVLEKAGMKDEELEAFEALKLNKLSIEEVAKRRDELRLMRELMFRHEIKAKRLKKIKSKSYRKLKREEMKRVLSRTEEIDHEISTEDQLKAATDRAEERMSLRHKNTSKWAKRALARGQADEGTRDAIMEQLQRGEELRRKIKTMASDDDDSDASGESMDEHEELASIERELDQDTQPKKGLFSMKFMQDAAKKGIDATKAMVDQFKEEWLQSKDGDEDSDPSKADSAAFTHVQNNPGRMAFGSTKKPIKPPKDNNKEEEDNVKAHVALNDAGQIKKVSHSASHNTLTSGPVNAAKVRQSPLSDLDGDNPWLQHDTSRLAKTSAKANKTVGKSDSKSEQNIAKIKKTQSEANALQDEDVELDLSQVLTVKKPNATATNSTTKRQSVATLAHRAAGASDDEDDAPTRAANPSHAFAFSQRELVARAFADDDVVEEFEAEKQAIIDEDGDKEEDITMPGWGRWDGNGIKKKNRHRVIKTTKGIDPKKRKDAKLSHVIISERKNKKMEKYQATQVPFPFQNMEQYERSLRTPMGKEWNTRDQFQKMTKPRVMTKLGTVIDPLHVPFK